MIMKKAKIINLLEYIPLILILSYFFLDNIYLVLIGITFSSYLLNINIINRIFKSKNKILFTKQVTNNSENNDNDKNCDSINIKLTKDDLQLTLVDAIEELGFIPSIDKND